MNYDMSNIPEYVRDLVTVPDGCCEDFFWFWFRQLMHKIVSVFDFKGLPETIDETYFTNCVFTIGWLPVFEHKDYGLIAQFGTPFSWDLYYRPVIMRIVNRFMNEELKVGEETELVRLTPDFRGPLDIIVNYARRLCLLETSLQVAMINTKMSKVLVASSKSMAKALEIAMTKIAAGQPAVIFDQSMLVENMQNNNQDVPYQNIEFKSDEYIIDKILEDMSRVMDEFDNEVGIPSSNTDKKERLISDEVSFGIADTVSKIDTWRKCLQDSLEKVNAMFNINITFEYNFEDYGKEQSDGSQSLQNNRRSENNSQK